MCISEYSKEHAHLGRLHDRPINTMGEPEEPEDWLLDEIERGHSRKESRHEGVRKTISEAVRDAQVCEFEEKKRKKKTEKGEDDGKEK